MNDNNLIADFLIEPTMNGTQGSVSKNAVKSFSSRSNTRSGGDFKYTSVRRPNRAKGTIPFKISLLNSKQLASSEEDESIKALILLVNPSDINIGSSQSISDQYGRDAHIVTMWGANQTTITGNGSSGAFITSNGISSGENIQYAGLQRKDTLAYANLISFIGLIRNNGYYGIRTDSEGSDYVRNPESFTPDKTTLADGKTAIDLIERPSYLTPIIGEGRTRVIHVMDTVCIKYDGTSYIGSFVSFTLDSSADKPYRFTYSFEFLCSGLLGDKVEGHINDGTNKNSGIIIRRPLTTFLPSGVNVSINSINDSLKKAKDATEKYSSSIGISPEIIDQQCNSSEGFSTDFTYAKLIASSTAKKYNLNNNCATEYLPNLCTLSQTLQKLKDRYGKGITITSGYRSPELNEQIENSAKGSYHMKGLAADIINSDGIIDSGYDLYDTIMSMYSELNIQQIGVYIGGPKTSGYKNDTRKIRWIHFGLGGGSDYFEQYNQVEDKYKGIDRGKFTTIRNTYSN